ncbi:MAG: flagellar basal body-associated FliL family protein [Roseibium sp.]
MSLTPYNNDQSGSGKSGLFAAFIVLGMIGAGAGAGLAKFVSDYTEQEVHGRIRHQQTFAETLPFSPSTRLQRLKPLVTNLTSPAGAWIRLQAAVLLEDDANTEVAILRKKVEDDFLGYLRTLNLSNLEGSIGLQHLREDLTERAKTRTKGQVHEVILESVVIQ